MKCPQIIFQLFENTLCSHYTIVFCQSLDTICILRSEQLRDWLEFFFFLRDVYTGNKVQKIKCKHPKRNFIAENLNKNQEIQSYNSNKSCSNIPFHICSIFLFMLLILCPDVETIHPSYSCYGNHNFGFLVSFIS